MPDSTHYWVVIPAAGVGQRMNAECPKQYLKINNRTVLEHTLDCFSEIENIEKVFVAISNTDTYWNELDLKHFPKAIDKVEGGSTRHESVLNCLTALRSEAADDDWVLVHDAARPCVTKIDLEKLFAATAKNIDGAILAKPATDTLKLAEGDKIKSTIDRSHIWQAMTPQMFRFEDLYQSLTGAMHDGFEVTDEASAIEHYGKQPVLINGRHDNLKITWPDDLQLAEFYLNQQGRIKS